jgi:hypothetical protein
MTDAAENTYTPAKGLQDLRHVAQDGRARLLSSRTSLAQNTFGSAGASPSRNEFCRVGYAHRMEAVKELSSFNYRTATVSTFPAAAAPIARTKSCFE